MGVTPESWIEVVWRVPPARQDEALARLIALGWDSAWCEQPVRHVRLPDGWRTEPDPDADVAIHVYPGTPEAAAELARELSGFGTVVVGALATEDWLSTWREGREVVPLSGGWSIAPPWLVDQAPDPARAVVIDPGLAFGAGDHPTTRDSAILILEALRPGDRVLDLGAGSGVLSLLALRAGAGSAVAVELDELAADEIRRNQALNSVDRLQVVCGDAKQLEETGPFDLLAVNIGAREAKLLADACSRWSAPDARLVLSGLADWAAAEAAEAYVQRGWRTRRRRQAGSEWVTLLMTRESRR